MKQSIFSLLSLLATLAAPQAYATAVPAWTLQNFQAAPCTYWDSNSGNCLSFNDAQQTFPDFNSTLAGLNIDIKAINELNARVTALEAKAGKPSKSEEVPAYSVTWTEIAGCEIWNTHNGLCLRWYTSMNYFPDYQSLLQGFKANEKVINDIDDRVAALETASPAGSPSASGKVGGWYLEPVEIAPCQMINSNDGSCSRWYSTEQSAPAYASALLGFNTDEAAVEALSVRVDRLAK